MPTTILNGCACPECGKSKRARKSHDEYAEAIHEANDQIELIGKYTKATERIKCKCKRCGLEWEPTAAELLNHPSCRWCDNGLVRYTQDSFTAKVESFGKVKVLGEYITTKYPVKVQCVKCGKIWDAHCSSLLSGCGCQQCSAKKMGKAKMLTHSEALKKIESMSPGITVTSSYNGSHNKINCRCDTCGFEWVTVASVLFGGAKCPKCIGMYKTHDEYIAMMYQKNPSIRILNRYEKWDTEMMCECLTCGNKFSKLASTLLQNPTCKKCGNANGGLARTKTHEQFLSEFYSIHNNIEPISIYTGCFTKMKFRCKVCGNEWDMKPISVLAGYGCPRCSLSLGENKILSWLERNNMIFIPQASFDGLYGIGGKPLRYDFYVLTHSLLIEFQGIQHYQAVGWFGGETTLEYQQEHDKRKKEFALSNGYQFLEITYKDDVEQILNKWFNIESVTTTGAVQ